MTIFLKWSFLMKKKTKTIGSQIYPYFFNFLILTYTKNETWNQSSWYKKYKKSYCLHRRHKSYHNWYLWRLWPCRSEEEFHNDFQPIQRYIGSDIVFPSENIFLYFDTVCEHRSLWCPVRTVNRGKTMELSGLAME